MRSEGKINQLTKVHIEDALTHLALLKKSARWKFGNGLVTLIEKVLFRKPSKLSIDKLEEHLQTIHKVLSQPSKGLQDSYKTLNLLQSVKIAFLVSDIDITKSIYGDTYVANDFKIALEKNENIYAELINHKQIVPDFDLVIAMLWDSQLEIENKEAVKIAWIRNHPEKWIKNPNFIHFDLILCSSPKILDFIKEHTDTTGYLFPIASNMERFGSSEKRAITNKICFVGNKFKEERKIEQVLKSNIGNIEIYGNGWDKDTFHHKVKGQIENNAIPELYRTSQIILDSANETTRQFESLNSRVFDAIASKRILITDSVESTSIFKYPIPTYGSVEELNKTIRMYQKDDARYSLDSEMLFEELKTNHTFDHRANYLKLILGKKLNIAIKIASTKDKKSVYGDSYFAEDLKSAFKNLNHTVRIDCIEDWYNIEAAGDDLVIVLRGLKAYKPLKGQTSFLWLISHPNDINNEELSSFNHLFVASEFHSNQLKNSGIKNVSCLEQCTNPGKFRFLKKNIEKNNKLLFVGNSRGIFRKSVKFATELKLDIDVYGHGWDQFIDSSYIKGDFVKNEDLFQLYNSYRIVLNDHWEDMVNLGYLNNRIFDASACGATLLTDKPIGSENVLPNLYYYSDKESFQNQVEKIYNTESAPLENYYAVNNSHTFKKRVEVLLEKYYSHEDA